MNFLKRNKLLAIHVCFVFTLNILLPSAFTDIFAQESFQIKRIIAVMAFNPPSDSGTRSMINAASSKIGNTKRFDLVPKDEVERFSLKLYREGNKASRDSLKEAQDMLSRGKEQYDRLQFKEAISSLKYSIKKYRGLKSYLHDATDLLRAQIYLAMAYVNTGDLRRGKKYINDTLRMDPERKTRKLSEAQFPPNIRAIYKTRQGVINRLKGGKIIIISSVPKSELYINGFKAGEIAGSHIIDDLPTGKHFLMIEKEGYSRFYKEVSLGTENVTINATMEEWNPFSDAGTGIIKDSDQTFLKDAAGELGADVLLLGSIKDLSEKEFVVKAQLFDAGTGNFSIVAEETFSGVKKAKKYFVKAVDKLMKKSLTASNEVVSFSYGEFAGITKPVDDNVEPVVVENFKEREKGPSIFGKWWFWAIIGGAGLAATGGVLLFTDIAKGDPSYNVLKINR